MARLQAGNEQITVKEHPRQQIVEVVRHSACQASHRLQTASLTEALLCRRHTGHLLRQKRSGVVRSAFVLNSPRRPAKQAVVPRRGFGVQIKAIPLSGEQF